MNRFNELREKHKKFIYHSYTVENGGFSFHFSIDDYHFNPAWTFPETLIKNDIDRQLVDCIVFSIGMVELVSYWKCACPPEVEVKCGALCDEQITWWKKLYWNGLGEFFYRNEIKSDFERFMHITADNTAAPKFSSDKRKLSGCLIPIGGGKDSVVTLELLKQLGEDNLCYIINPRGATLKCAYTGGYGDDKIVGVHRTIDKQLLELNKLGYLNGHTPFSSIIAFSSYLFAYLTGRKYITLSNESSANEANVGGTEINHQYSKSTEFERDFREYASKYFLPYPEYFSFLRPWSEWQIARQFVKYPQYFGVFQSCNVGSKTDTWCADCAKCLYVYIMLSAFLDDETLYDIFGKNMLNDEKYTDMFNGLVYCDYDKPFECVGTRDEINLALQTAAKRRTTLPRLLEAYMLRDNYTPKSLDDFYDRDNFLPEKFKKILNGAIK